MRERKAKVFVGTIAGYRRGFSLMELSVVLLLLGLFAGGAMTMFGATSRQKCHEQTKAQLTEISTAVKRFAMSNDRYPLPARRNSGVDSPNYGREVEPTNNVLIDSDLDNFINPAGTLPVGKVTTFGALPFVTLGFGLKNSVDCWGNKFIYVVSRELTEPKVAGNNKFLTGVDGAFDIFTQASAATPFLKGAGYAIISHGADQLGAVKNNWSDPAATTLATRKWCTLDAAARNKTENCDASNNVLVSANFNDGKDAVANFFDDLIVFSRAQRIGPVALPCLGGLQSWGFGCSVNVVGPLAVGTTTLDILSTSGVAGSSKFKCNANVIPANPGTIQNIDDVCTGLPSPCVAGLADISFGNFNGLGNDCRVILAANMAHSATATFTADGTLGLKGTGDVVATCNNGNLFQSGADTCKPSCRTGAVTWGPGNVCAGGWVLGDPVLFFNDTRVINTYAFPNPPNLGTTTVRCIGRDTIEVVVGTDTCVP